jgi:serine protease Do
VIVTNAHVIPDDLDSVASERWLCLPVVAPAASQRLARLRREGSEHDLALLRLRGRRASRADAGRRRDDSAGEAVAFTGFPIGAVLGLYPATHGHCRRDHAGSPGCRPRCRQLTPVQLRRLRSPYDVYQLDAIAYPGNSGSAVYGQESGEVIGVMNSVFIKESRENLLARPSGIAYAIPVRHLRALLAGLD